ncbi:hypothetical protein, variant 1 [Aphanomyces invadans]|uniref:Uncharacterized protein n=1 Tax=Aphanomyces invadans TaxID=157072 RepID=A0A024UNE1_9STRA|nr:hypothetical protein, variant 1 [Aphanomyces invadans]ETW07931.1 hypothetical protein, variant 1 [Aphanomyces invadans]|eukprot:XP_008864024.1 hypothetical protein, variant 1 [Aphanomyces invadans]
MATISVVMDSDTLDSTTRHANGTGDPDNEVNVSDNSGSPNTSYADQTSVSSPATSSSTVSMKSGGDDDMEDEDGGLSDSTTSTLTSANDPSTTTTTTSAPAKKPYVMGTAESNGLRRTVKVVVQRTTDVEQRLPQMVHKIGVIVETPRHPNTWFRVRFRSGKIHTFRASGLKLLKDAQADGDDVDLSEIPEDHDLGPPSDDEHDSGGPPPPPPPSDDTHRFDKHDKVTIKLVDPTKRELADLRGHDGKRGVVQEVLSNGGFKVLLDRKRQDGSPTTVVIKQSKHLTLRRRRSSMDSASRDSPDESGTMSEEEDNGSTKDVINDEGSDGDNEDEEDETVEDEPSRHQRKGKKKDSGSLLSDLDTELWIGRRVRINVGKFSGQAAVVLKSGNGWVQLKMEGGHESTAKRAYELTLLESIASIERQASSGSAGDNGGSTDTTLENDNDLDDVEDSGSEHGSRVAGSSGGLRRRGHYAQSWIEKKVYLPGNQGTGVVKKADRDVCTVEVENASKTIKVFKKQELVLIEDDFTIQHRHRRPNKANNSKLNLPDGVVLMGITTQRYAMFQDQVKKHVMRRRDKIKMRPNLMEWQAILDSRLRTAVDVDTLADVVDLFVLPSCELCGVEKQELNGVCWNMKCPRCPVFDWSKADGGKGGGYSRLPATPLTDRYVSLQAQVSYNAAIAPPPPQVAPVPEPESAVAPLTTNVQDASAASRKRKRKEHSTVEVTTDDHRDSPPPAPVHANHGDWKPDEPPLPPVAIKVEAPREVPSTTSSQASPTLPLLPVFRPQYESVFSKKM